jgi:protein-histidine pros-kinase
MFEIALTEICRQLGWPVGCAYVVGTPGRLHGIASYSSDDARFEPFWRATAAIDFSEDTGFLGPVLKKGTTTFLPDVRDEDGFLRKNAAAQAGLKSWLAIPVIVQNQPAAIIEFFYVERIEARDSVLEIMDVIAAYLSHVIERKRAEKKLQALFDSAPDAQIVTDTLGMIVMANRQTERLFAYSQETLLGQPVEVLIPTELRAGHIQHRAQYAAAPHARPMGIGMELTALAADGSGIPVEVSLSPVELDEGLLIASAIRDVRERKKLEAKLREKERLAEMGSMAAIFAHEIANPLNGISCNAQFIKSSLPAEYHGLIDDLSADIGRLESLLNQFRSLSSLENLKLARVEFTTLIERVVNNNARYWSELGVRIITEYTRNLTVQADADRLHQVILNLSKNAIESMTGGGTLIVRTYATSEDAIFEISDSGPGIPEGVDVFDLFTTTKPKGNGMGLYIARQIVSAHHGTITYSTEQGKGTTFRVRLPIQKLDTIS